MLFNIIHVASEFQEIHPNGVVNIDNVEINVYKKGQYLNNRTWVHVKNLVFSNTRYPQYPMILKINWVQIGY